MHNSSTSTQGSEHHPSPADNTGTQVQPVSHRRVLHSDTLERLTTPAARHRDNSLQRPQAISLRTKRRIEYQEQQKAARQRELEQKREAERQRELEIEQQRQLEQEREAERQRELELARQRQLEQEREAERQRQIEEEHRRQREAARQRQIERERQREIARQQSHANETRQRENNQESEGLSLSDLMNLNTELTGLLEMIMSIDPGDLPGPRRLQVLALQMQLAAFEEAQLNYALELSMREAERQRPQPPKRVEMKEHLVSLTEWREEKECAICLSNFSYHEEGVIKLKCGHVFHRDCVSQWFEGHHTCPTCRADIDEG